VGEALVLLDDLVGVFGGLAFAGEVRAMRCGR
jgi:hypothetical protein